jgi:transposase
MMTDPNGTILDAATSTLASDRMSARPRRIEVITGGERRRRWSPEQKQAIVLESLSSNIPLTAVARKHGIGTGLLYSWRHQLLTRRPGEVARFARVEMAGELPRLAGPIAAPNGLIEIVLAGGTSVRVDALVDESALRRVLVALRE